MCVKNLCVNIVIFILCLAFAVNAQKCGTVSPEGKEVPWGAGIYNKRSTDGRAETRELLCGGTLISSKVVLTAAARVSLYYGLPQSMEVVVGRLSSHFSERKTSDITQKSDIEVIHLAPGYKELSDYPYFVDDIAVVIVTDAFLYNDNIRPVCLDFDHNFEQQQLTEGNVGKTSIWGYIAPGFIGSYAKKLSFVNREICATNKSMDSLNVALASDKICLQDEEHFDILCRTDIGVGISFASISKGIEQYYLRGVYSQSVDSDMHCTTKFHHEFNLLRKHESFIRKYWNETEEQQKSIGKCLLPAYPEHGSYSINVTHVPGSDEFLLVVLTITCDGGYGVLGNTAVNCYNGFWPEPMPICVRMCRLDPHPSLDYRCLVSGSVVGDRTCAINEPIGTIVNPRCRGPDYYSPTNLPFMRCKKDAQWDYVARCLPECGIVTPGGKELVSGGVRAKKGELPWHAGVYRTNTQPYMQICGGSLISKKLILSAAHCFWNSIEKLQPASQFAVAVGKIYRPWDDPMDEAQKSDVKEIHIPSRYQGVDANFQEDIAVLVVASPFELKRFVRPVCLSFDPNFDRLQLQTSNKGKVAGWGLTGPNTKASPVLQVLELPYVEIGTCIKESPSDFRGFITSDKICAGTQHSNSALCMGDSGGGLAFPAIERDVERYYLRGVVSTAPSNNDACNTDTYTSFTQVIKHQDFIQPFLT